MGRRPRRKAEGIGAHQAALVAIRPSTGEILAMVGGAGAFSLTNQFNRAWQARRQPGSSFKAYVYTAAIDGGLPPTTIVDDTPVAYPMGDGTRWAPMDDDYRFLGAITLRYALAQSRNVVAVKLAQHLGIDRVIEYAHRMGVNAPLEATLSLALGSSVVSPLDQAAGYATLANARHPHRALADSPGARFARHAAARQSLSAADRSGQRRRRLRRDLDAGVGHQRGHRLSQRRHRPARRRQDRHDLDLSATPGSSATRRTSSPRCGSATTTTRA